MRGTVVVLMGLKNLPLIADALLTGAVLAPLAVRYAGGRVEIPPEPDGVVRGYLNRPGLTVVPSVAARPMAHCSECTRLVFLYSMGAIPHPDSISVSDENHLLLNALLK